MTAVTSPSSVASFRIQFQSAFFEGQTISFPCDARGNVDIDELSETGRRDYLFARVMVRREYLHPEVIISLAGG